MMKVLFIVPELDRPSTINGVLLYRPYLEQKGAHVEIVPCPGAGRGRRDLFNRAGDFDVVLLHKKLLPRRSFFRLRRNARKLAYIFEDAILYRGPDSDHPRSMTRRFRFRRIVRQVDSVWASNHYLADLAAQFLPSREKIFFHPIAIDLKEWSPKEYGDRTGEPAVLGWMGGEKNLVYLDDLRGAFEEVGRRRPGTILRIVSRESLDFDNIHVDHVQWSKEREVQDIQSFDVGLAPLRDDLWTRGKNTLKILNYYGAAIPVVASPVGINAEIVQDGETGFAPATPDEWVDSLCELIDHPERRRDFGFAGRKLVEERFSLQARAPIMWRELQRLAGG
jgi:glycosyltransferase involved in cell wall biosynthesis